jgi:hypothetical protein
MLIDEHMTGCQTGPIKADCPFECLRGVLSTHAYLSLKRAPMATFEPPRTVGEVALLCQQGKLSEIRGLGPRRIGEIQLCLIVAGLISGEPRKRHQAL